MATNAVGLVESSLHGVDMYDRAGYEPPAASGSTSSGGSHRSRDGNPNVAAATDTPSGTPGGTPEGSGRKRKPDVSDEKKPKKTRQTPCRARKVKCDRPPPGSAADVPTKDVCSHCRQLGMACTFEYKPKKRGPPNMYLKRMQALNQAAAYPEQRGDYSARRRSNEHVNEDAVSGPGPGTLAKQNALHHSALADQGLSGLGTRGMGRDVVDDWTPALALTVAAHKQRNEQMQLGQLNQLGLAQGNGAGDGSGNGNGFSLSPSFAQIPAPPERDRDGRDPSQGRKGRDALEARHEPSPHSSSGGRHEPSPHGQHLDPSVSRSSHGASPHTDFAVRPNYSFVGVVAPPQSGYPHSPFGSMSNSSQNPIEAVLPRPLLIHLIELYFDYVYCLVPCLHKPTFMHDLHSHREELPGQEEWVALVFAVIEVTLVQMPRSFVSLPKREIKVLLARVHSMVKSYIDREFHELNISRCIIIYLHAIAAHYVGNGLLGDVLFGSNYMLSLRLRLNDETSYEGLNPIERELRRRIFWLQYGGDKTIAAIDGSTTIFHECDWGDVALPSPLDDEFLTEEGYLEQPAGYTPVLAGFYYISKLFRLLGQALDKRRSDRAMPPAGLVLEMRIAEVDQIFHQVMTLMDNCPEALKLDMGGTPGARMDIIDEQWDAQMSQDIRQLLLDPSKANRAIVKDGFLVQQANIYVTQQMVRYIILLYREELGVLQENELGGIDEGRSRMSVIRRPGFTEEERDQVASDLLMVLSKIRIEVIAVNSAALVAKVRFVASTLLDALQTPPVRHQAPEVSARMQRTQGYLWDFLRILSDIEALYVLDDDE